MKKIYATISAMAILLTASTAICSCSSHHDDVPQPTTVWLTVDASKGDYAESYLTRALDANMVFTWATTDKVYFFTSAGNQLGSLSPQTGGSTRTKLGGAVPSSSLHVGDKLSLLYPRDTWDYTGQNGDLTPASAGATSIASHFDYATAIVTVLEVVSANEMLADNAIFGTEQAIVRFILKNADGSADLSTSTLNISAASGKLVQKCSVNGTATNYGNLAIVPGAAKNEFYVALRNDNAGADSYTLSCTGTDTKLYSYTKSDVTFEKGKFKTITVKMKLVDDTYTERTGYDNLGNETWD